MTVAISFWVAQIIGNSMGTIVALCLLCHPWACLPAGIFLLLQVCMHCYSTAFLALSRYMYILMNASSYHGQLLVQLAVVALPVGEAPYIVERYAPPCMMLSQHSRTQ